jgi:hypothetical protein
VDPELLESQGYRARQRCIERGAGARHEGGHITASVVAQSLTEQYRLTVPRSQSTGDTRRVHLCGGTGVSRHGGRGER